MQDIIGSKKGNARNIDICLETWYQPNKDEIIRKMFNSVFSYYSKKPQIWLV